MQVNNHLSFPDAPAITSALEKGAVKIRDRDQPPKPEPVKQSSDIPMVKKEASTEEIERESQDFLDKLKNTELHYISLRELAEMKKSLVNNKSGCVEKIDFTVLQPGPDKKPAKFDCKLFRSSTKPHSIVFAKTPWGENYTGFIQNAYPTSIERGFIQGDQGSSYTAEIKYQRTSGSLHLKPLQKDGAEGHGVITKKQFFRHLEPQPTE